MKNLNEENEASFGCNNACIVFRASNIAYAVEKSEPVITENNTLADEPVMIKNDTEAETPAITDTKPGNTDMPQDKPQDKPRIIRKVILRKNKTVHRQVTLLSRQVTRQR